jgi:hypothetical protein
MMVIDTLGGSRRRLVGKGVGDTARRRCPATADGPHRLAGAIEDGVLRHRDRGPPALMSAIGAQGMSQSQMSWWTSW